MKETIAAIERVYGDFLIEMSVAKGQEFGWKAAAARARKHSLELEKLLKQFRKDSVRAANESKQG